MFTVALGGDSSSDNVAIIALQVCTFEGVDLSDAIKLTQCDFYEQFFKRFVYNSATETN